MNNSGSSETLGSTGEAQVMKTPVDTYYEKLTLILDADLNHSKTRSTMAIVFLVILVLLLGWVVLATECFISDYKKALGSASPIPEKFAITFLIISGVKVTAIIGASAAYIFRGFPHQRIPENRS
jgi:hypothetical protein